MGASMVNMVSNRSCRVWVEERRSSATVELVVAVQHTNSDTQASEGSADLILKASFGLDGNSYSDPQCSEGKTPFVPPNFMLEQR